MVVCHTWWKLYRKVMQEYSEEKVMIVVFTNL